MRSLDSSPVIVTDEVMCVFMLKIHEAGSHMRSEFLTQPEPILHPYLRA